jgi:Domain of unknown function (DUF4331)
MKIKQILSLGVIGLGLIVVVAAFAPNYVQASDHDDGEVDTKGRNVNLTDLYVFREKDQNPKASDQDLVFVMNTNPRSLARQQYFFSTNALYEFKVSHVANKDDTPTGKEDVTIRFQFGAPNEKGEQRFKVAIFGDGVAQVSDGKTTPLSPDPNAAPFINNISSNKGQLSVFAGLREDPFFFDVEQYFRVRAGALGIGPAVGFRPPGKALDFAAGYNVNSIVVRIPRAILQGKSQATTFDVWQTISLRDPRTAKFRQFERLGRPGVNEALVVTNDFLQAFNSIPPSADLSNAAAPVRAEAKTVLKAFGNDDATADKLLNAFLPDVLRIDTTLASGYLNAVNAKGSPITGRLLLDDVVDQTLSVLTGGKVPTDNVSYNGQPENPGTGHKPLVADFPYLALPN